MITVTIKDQDQGQIGQPFTSEVVGFTWMSRANEGTTFSSSVPNMNATVTILSNTVDEDGIKDWKYVTISQDSATGTKLLDITMHIIETTYLERKGTVEIYCSPMFMSPVDDTYGYMKIPGKRVLTNTELKYVFGLQNLVLHSELSEEVPVNAKKKEDLIMGINWGLDKRHAISLLPFSYKNNDFANGDVAIFQDERPISQSSAKQPVYRIYPEDIINYDVEAAQPPVTHIISRTSGVPRARNYVTVKVRNAIEILESFVDSDDGIGAEMVVRYEGGQYYEPTAELRWIDGTSVTVNAPYTNGSPIAVGVIPGRYLIGAANNRVQLMDKETETMVSASSYVSVPDVDAIDVGRSITRYMDFTDGRHYYVLLDRMVDVSSSRSIIGFHVSPTNSINVMYANTTSYGYISPRTCVTWIYGSQSNQALLIFYGREGQRGIRLVISNENKDTEQIAYTQTPTLKGTGTVMSIIAEASTADMYVLWSYVASTSDGIKLERVGTSSTSVLFANTDVTQACWSYSRATVGPRYQLTPIIAMGSDGLSWKYGKLNTSGASIKWLYSGDATEWIEDTYAADIWGALVDNAVRVYRHQVAQSESEYDAILSVGLNAITTRSEGEASIYTELADGVYNGAEFRFKIGEMKNISKDTVEPDLGRVEVELAKFYIVDLTNKTETAVYSNDLAIMAMNSYIVLKLDPNDTNTALAKVIGYSLNYEGAVTAKVSAIIVDKNFNW